MWNLIKDFDQFFTEEDGKLSNIRLNSALCVVAAIWLCLSSEAIDLGAVGLLLAAGFGPKVFQKSLESRSTDVKSST